MTKNSSNSENNIDIEVVEDPDSYIQSRRLKDIFEARREVRQQRQKAKEITIDSFGSKNESVNKSKARRLYRASVENYLTELRPLFHSDKLGEKYWYSLDLGKLVSEPSVYYASSYRRSGTQLKYEYQGRTYQVLKKPDQKEIDLTGLKCLFEIDDPIVATFDLVVDSKRLGKNRTYITVTEEQNVPFKKLDSIVNEANSYLQKRGIELDPEEGLPEDELQL